MIVTGDQDIVPGLVTDWHDHLLPIQTSPAGNKLAVTYSGAAHELIGHPDDANYASAASESIAFLKAYGLGDQRALTILRNGKDASGASWFRR
jgi:hypothetical protein